MAKGKGRKTVQQEPTDTSSKRRIIESYTLVNIKKTIKSKFHLNQSSLFFFKKYMLISKLLLFLPLITIGDFLLVSVGKSRPDVAKVNQVVEEEGEVLFHITWYMWPKDTKQGKQGFHGVNEVFSTSWHDIVKPENIEETCTVYTIREYQNIKATAFDFFCRTSYDHVKKCFRREESLPVYCLCESPYNPDYPAILCETCKDWFHPKCVNIQTMSEFEIARAKKWYCPKCKPSESAS